MAFLCHPLRIHLLLIAVTMAATADENNMHEVIYRGCSDKEYNQGSEYESNLNRFLESMALEGQATAYFYKQKVGQVYGVFQCKGDTSEKECQDCKRSVALQAPLLCGSSVGARVQLRGCFLRYENSKFFGAPDLELVYKACSPEMTTDPVFFARRDNVLAGLEQGSFSGNNFRVTSSGGDSNLGPPVYGYAQCEGDLSWPDCADCILNAATDVKHICGNSVAGQVYLQKCSVSYGQDDAHTHHDTESNHVTAKTVAIVIGGVAALIFAFIFLLFLKSLCRNAD